MSDFMEMFCDMLPIASEIQKEDNPLRKVLNKTIGAYMDNQDDIFDELFLMTATGGWLDAHGKDYGVPRKINESDEDYRKRIVFEKLEYLTANNLQEMYELQLFNYIANYDATQNQITSDNAYISNNHMSIADESIQKILNKKFILENNLFWLNGEYSSDYIINTNNQNVLNDYLGVYSVSDARGYFRRNTNIYKVKLQLHSSKNDYMFTRCSNLVEADLILNNSSTCQSLFDLCSSLEKISLKGKLIHDAQDLCYDCSSLTDVSVDLPNVSAFSGAFQGCTALTTIDLNLPKATSVYQMFSGCSNLKNVTLNMPVVWSYFDLFYDCTNLKYINLTVPSGRVAGIKTYIESLNLQYLETLIINGEVIS